MPAPRTSAPTTTSLKSSRRPDNKLDAVTKALDQARIPVASSKLSYVPGNLTPVTDAVIAEQVLTLIEALDDHDDVQTVHANFDMAPELLTKNC